MITAKHFCTFQKFKFCFKNFKNLKKFKNFKFALISETVRDRAKPSKFPAFAGLQHTKLQILKFLICWFLIG